MMAVKAERRRRGRPPGGAQRIDSRRRLLRAAAKVFAKQGYRGASVDRVVAAAQLSKGTFYWNFNSKEELFFALIDERIDQPIRELTELMKTASPEADMGAEASRQLAEVLYRNRESVVLDHEYWTLAVREPKLRRRYARRRTALRDELAAALQARMRRLGAPTAGVNPHELATAFLCLASGIAQAKLVDPGATPDDLFGKIAVVIYSGLVARGSQG